MGIRSGFRNDGRLRQHPSVEDARKDYGERRLRVLGHIEGQLHAAVITARGDAVRVISLRRANTREERAYEKERQSP